MLYYFLYSLHSVVRRLSLSVHYLSDCGGVPHGAIDPA
jgi:hypothetical protein